MNGFKYLVNFKAPIGGVEASLSVSGDDAFQVVADAKALLALVYQGQGQEPVQPQPLLTREQTAASTSNGHKDKIPVVPTTNGHTPECPEHHRGLPSKFGDWLYCPEQLEDGTRCTWTTKPKKAAK